VRAGDEKYNQPTRTGKKTRSQAVAVIADRTGQFSQWLTLAGGMPQGSLIGPLTFILLIDNLRLHCLTHNVDDTTLSELLPRGSPDSAMQSYLQDLHV